jgi:hypothetical protein
VDCWKSGGFSFYDELLARTLLPVGVGAALVLRYAPSILRGADGNTARRRQLTSDMASWIFFSCFFFFPSASTAVFQTFNTDKDFDGGDCWLKADYSLSCRADDATYAATRRTPPVMMLVYPIGIPLFFLAVLLWNRRTIAKPRGGGGSPRSLASTSARRSAAGLAADFRAAQAMRCRAATTSWRRSATRARRAGGWWWRRRGASPRRSRTCRCSRRTGPSCSGGRWWSARGACC